MVLSTWLDPQLVGDSHDYFQDGHEGGDLTEVAAADHLGVDLQAPLVVLARHTAADLMKPVQDVVGKLKDRQRHSITTTDYKMISKRFYYLYLSYIILPYRLLSQLVVQTSQTFGCIIKFSFCLLKSKNVLSSHI